MMKSTFLASLLALVPLSALTGCAQDDGQEAQNLGQVRMALEGTAASGTVYRLVGAVFVISGPTSEVVTPADDAASALVDLPAGNYEIELVDGWSFAQVNEDGSLTTVEATLVSPNPQSFSIADGMTTGIQFLFDADESVLLGEGTLDLSIGIVDQPQGILLGSFENGVTGSDFGGNWFGLNGLTQQILSDESAPVGSGYIAATSPQGAIFGFLFQNADFFVGEYENLTFWYRSSAPLEFEFHTPETVSNTVLVEATCTTGCWDGFKGVTPASTNWVRAEIPLSSLAQAGWGTPAGAGLEHVLLIYVRLTGNSAGTFDLDEIRLE